jgi:hypothetical protein
MRVLGISAYYHDSAAALVEDGRIVAAAQEERFSRKKHDARFPAHALDYCLGEAGIKLDQVDWVAFYDKPFLKFERLLETYLAFAPRGFQSFRMAMPLWLKEKLFQKDLLRKELRKHAPDFDWSNRLLFAEHHQSHAASAFHASPFERAAVLTMDGVGEWATTSAALGAGSRLEIFKELHWPHSLGLLYSAFTYYTGFKVNSGEYKVMGLAPYGEPRFKQRILDELMDLKEDGSFRLNLDYFDYCTGLRMTNDRFADLFGGPARGGETLLTQHHMDLAASIQAVTEEAVLRITRALASETGEKNLCLAERSPVARRTADAAVDHELVRPLRHLGIEVVHQHPERRLGLPAPGADCGPARRADRSGVVDAAHRGPPVLPLEIDSAGDRRTIDFCRLTSLRDLFRCVLDFAFPCARSPTMYGTDRDLLSLSRRQTLAALAAASLWPSMARAAPGGMLTWAVHVSLAPTWLDPAETPGLVTPFMIFYALHDAMLKAMPDNRAAPSLAESWSATEDGTEYRFLLRQGVTFHNGEPVTAEDVKFSFERYRGTSYKLMKDKVAAIETPDARHVIVKLKAPWPDFLSFYVGATGAGWIVPKTYVEQVGEEGFKKAPIGAGPYKFVSFRPGVELVLEA